MKESSSYIFQFFSFTDLLFPTVPLVQLDVHFFLFGYWWPHNVLLDDQLLKLSGIKWFIVISSVDRMGLVGWALSCGYNWVLAGVATITLLGLGLGLVSRVAYPNDCQLMPAQTEAVKMNTYAHHLHIPWVSHKMEGGF